MNRRIEKQIKNLAFALYDPDHEHRCFHLTFILYKGRVLSIGKNQNKTHPVNLRNRKLNRDGEDISENKMTCSEWSAIRHLINHTNIKTTKCTLVNVRINKNKKITNSKPCNSCRKLLTFFSFKNIYYSNTEQQIISY